MLQAVRKALCSGWLSVGVNEALGPWNRVSGAARAVSGRRETAAGFLQPRATAPFEGAWVS